METTAFIISSQIIGFIIYISLYPLYGVEPSQLPIHILHLQQLAYPLDRRGVPAHQPIQLSELFVWVLLYHDGQHRPILSHLLLLHFFLPEVLPILVQFGEHIHDHLDEEVYIPL